ncbi:uncharacterized protein LOC131954798 isoform X2 [Physella acuta]|uniref:uncharacterized protein LOC131954798 isoform X2 n=1 Tax=Physella acuta TaxID=109671 RepID=UPI0027DBD3DF|nr:uncharacterized protein LOC131954798 isoform X2 [Physella acuta]
MQVSSNENILLYDGLAPDPPEIIQTSHNDVTLVPYVSPRVPTPDPQYIPSPTSAIMEEIDQLGVEDKVKDLLHMLREELKQLKETVGKQDPNLHKLPPTVTVDPPSAFHSPHPGHTDTATRVASMTQPTVTGTMGTKAAPPGGMTADQLQEFKKMTLQINALQQKIKDLENKLTEAAVSIKKGTERVDEMEEKESENVKDLYKCMDQINNSLSEKIAQQKVEVQKIAGDTPKPINYDPFNYGEAYGGDVVDFQARKRILEMKLLLQGLQTSMNQMRDSVKVSPSIDLGFKVVRLDQLLASSGFARAMAKGEVNHEDGLVISNSTTRDPSKVDYPKKEMFQVTSEMESQWAITDSIMQTMYRLEMELGELQRVVGASDLSSNTRLLEDLQASIRQVKEKAVDVKTVKRLMEESQSTKVHTQLSSFDKKVVPQNTDINPSSSVQMSKSKSDYQIKSLSATIGVINKRLAKIEQYMEKRPNAATSKTKLKGPIGETACLSCDRESDVIKIVEKSLPDTCYFNPSMSPRDQQVNKSPPRLRYLLNRGYNIDLNNEVAEIYNIPRPVGGSYVQYWPKMVSFHGQPKKTVEIAPPAFTGLATDTKFIKGSDGRVYRADIGSLKMKKSSSVAAGVLASKKKSSSISTTLTTATTIDNSGLPSKLSMQTKEMMKETLPEELPENTMEFSENFLEDFDDNRPRLNYMTPSIHIAEATPYAGSPVNDFPDEEENNNSNTLRWSKS